MSTRTTGQSAEILAMEHLAGQGLKMVTNNYRCKTGELDLIMEQDDTLVIIEVRKRSHASFGGALASITPGKIRRIINSSQHFLMTHPELQDRPVRFDVIGIDGTNDIEWIQDAFQT